MKDYLFVYGTLSPESAPPEIRDSIDQLDPVASGSMPGRIYALGEYPGAIYDRAASTRVQGKVFELPQDETLLHVLDAYEECIPGDHRSSLFVRKRLPIDLANGDQVTCWVYLYNQSVGDAPVISSGSYLDWVATHPSSHP